MNRFADYYVIQEFYFKYLITQFGGHYSKLFDSIMPPLTNQNSHIISADVLDLYWK